MIKDYKTELEKNGIIGFVPRGSSMWPMLKDQKHSVIILPIKDKLKPLDVAFYIRNNGHYVLHRVKEVLDDGYLIQGDSQYSTEHVLFGQVIGYMAGFYKGKKYIECTDKKYRKKVERYYKHKFIRKVRLKLFYIRKKLIEKHSKKEDDGIGKDD